MDGMGQKMVGRSTKPYLLGNMAQNGATFFGEAFSFHPPGLFRSKTLDFFCGFHIISKQNKKTRLKGNFKGSPIVKPPVFILLPQKIPLKKKKNPKGLIASDTHRDFQEMQGICRGTCQSFTISPQKGK